ncbi:MAG TPA: HAD-IA family hydrolase [Candidatus Nanoarchaeia archaeon]|nr:HAD-IA family hydrolase [Candidatus Nanoarchaeia archaeon]
MIKAVILDLNGVFLKSKLLSDRMEEKHEVPTEEFISALKEIMPKVREPKAASIYKLFTSYFKAWKLKITEEEFLDFWFGGETLVKELLNYIKELKEKGLKIFILSNNFKERTKHYRKRFPELFNTINKAYFSWETGFVKPSEKAFRYILEENNLDPEDCIYFDDSQKNVDAANLIGITALKYEGIQKVKEVIEKLIN